MLDKKGQGAMEYLMTYGWAILVVMIVGVVLWQLGIFGGGPGSVNTARGFGRIKVMDTSIKYAPDVAVGNDDLTFIVMNGAGQTVTSVVMTVSGSGCAAGSDGVAGTLGAGATDTVALDCDLKSGGDSFAVDISFAYTMTVAGSAVTRSEKGTLRGTVELT